MFLKETRLIISCSFLSKIANRVCYANIVVSSTAVTVNLQNSKLNLYIILTADLPRSAVRIFWLEVVSQGGRDDGLYGVHPVLGLIEYK